MALDFTVSGTGGSAPKTDDAPAAKSTGLDFTAPKTGGGSKKKSKGFLGIDLPDLPGRLPNLPAIGVTTDKKNPVTQVANLVTGLGPGLARLGGGLAKELVPPNPFTAKHDPESMGWQGVEKDMPLTGSILESVARTGRQIPDTAVAVRPGGPGFGQSNLGHQIRDEGYLATGLAKLGDLSLLAGGAGLAVKGVTGGGKLAQASRLERLAGATSEAAGLGKTPNYGKLTAAAAKADAASDAGRAADLAKAAEQVLEAAKLRIGVAGAGKATRATEKFTETAFKLARGGDRASALPFVPTQKALGLVGKGAGKLARSERLAPVAGAVSAAAARAGDRMLVGDLYHETVRAPFEGEMHAVFERYGIEDVARNLSREEQAAVYLTKSQEAADPAIRRLLDTVDTLPEEVRPNAIAEIFPDGSVTPEMLALARAFEEGALPEAQAAKMQAAADALTAVQTGRERTRYVTGRGASRDLSPEAIEAREQRARGESAQMDVDAAVERRTAATRGRLAGIRDELDELNTAPDPDPAPLSRAQERQAARDAERTRRRAETVKGETARGERLLGAAGREVASAQGRAAARTGQVIGRARGRLEEAGQLETGLAARSRAADLKARRLAKSANAADARAAELPDPKKKPAEPKFSPKTGKYKMTPKQRAESGASAKGHAADEARADATKLKGINAAPSRAEVQRSVNQEARVANTASRAETGTTNRLLGKQVTEQQAAVAKAQRKLERAQTDEAGRLDKFERENHARADAKQRKRFETLQKRETAALERLAKETQEAIDSVEAAPPQDRPALIVARRAKEFALNLAEAYPERAQEFLALADDIADSKAKLDAKGIKTEYFFGGPELGRPTNVPPTAKLRTKKMLQNERTRTRGVLARNVKAQTDKYANETLDILHNEFHGQVDGQHGSSAADEIGKQRFATSEERAASLHDTGKLAWDPKTGRALMDDKTGKLVDGADITDATRVLDAELFKTLKKYTAKRDPNMLLRVYDKVTGGWKHSVLALSPRWHVGNIVGNAALAGLGAGLSPAQIAKHVGEARRLVKAFEEGGDVPAEHLVAMERLIAAGFNNPDLARVENARALGRAINRSYHFNGYVDSVNRTVIYLAKHKSGVSADAAVSMALKTAGDFSKMTPFERNVVRRIIPFYAWQRHITRLAFSLPVEHPSRVAWTLHLSEMQNRLNPDPGADNEFNEGTIPLPGGKRLNVRNLMPITSGFWLDPSFRGAGYQLNPVIKSAVAGATGFNLGKMKPVSGKEFDPKNPSRFGAPPEALAAKNPGGFVSFLGQQLPQVTTLRDLVAGDAPVRYDTGEPRKVGPGATKKTAKPTLTGRGRKETIARLLGVPVPETETKAVTKKK